MARLFTPNLNRRRNWWHRVGKPLAWAFVAASFSLTLAGMVWLIIRALTA